MWEAIRLRTGLEQVHLFFLRAGSGVEDMGDRIVSAVTVFGAWADCGVIAEATEDLTTHGALCVVRRNGVVCVVVFGPEADAKKETVLLLEAKMAVGQWRTGPLMPNPLLLEV